MPFGFLPEGKPLFPLFRRLSAIKMVALGQNNAEMTPIEDVGLNLEESIENIMNELAGGDMGQQAAASGPVQGQPQQRGVQAGGPRSSGSLVPLRTEPQPCGNLGTSAASAAGAPPSATITRVGRANAPVSASNRSASRQMVDRRS